MHFVEFSDKIAREDYMALKSSMLRVHQALTAAGAPHALIGGMALSALGKLQANCLAELGISRQGALMQ